MGQRASQPNGRPPMSQGCVRSANAPGTCAGNTSANSPTPAGSLACQLPAARPGLDEWMRPKTHETRNGSARGTLAFTRLSTRLALLGQRGPAICCTVSRSDSLELTEYFTSRLSEVASQLRKDGGVSLMNAQPRPRAASGLTFDTRSLSSGCDSEINTESQGDLSCRRNKRTRLPRSVRLPYENRSGDRIW